MSADDGAGTSPSEAHNSPNDARTDQAALIGASLGAMIAVALADSDWDTFDSIAGVALIGVLVGYYRPVCPRTVGERVRKASAFSALVGLCLCIILAAPVKEQWFSYHRLGEAAALEERAFNRTFLFVWLGSVFLVMLIWLCVWGSLRPARKYPYYRWKVEPQRLKAGKAVQRRRWRVWLRRAWPRRDP
ncbi:hypothetical protein [Actinomycetospora flava]|uniref:Uncharacterized protein n=1 Tax=Actinomycetospora flava TaxID=3129232 RepID=A0ABU8M6V6_9PSEU